MIVAHNNSVICKCIVPADGTIDAGGIVIPVKNLPIYGLSAPHSRTFLAKKYMIGTGIILPMIQIIKDWVTGRPSPWEIGMAPLSSISGTIDTKNIDKYLINILVLL